MLLLVGLGNPGAAYSGHRHNVGFMAVDAIVRRHAFGVPRSKFRGLLSAGELAGRKVLALCPQTFMNESGRSVVEATRFYKIPVEDVVVFHDEIDLASGKLKLKKGGGAAGHNGLRSIDRFIGNGYRRVRIGVGHPGHKDRVHGYVLHDFAKADQIWLDPMLDAIADAAPLLAAGEDGKFMTRVAALTQPTTERRRGKPARKGEEKVREDGSDGV
ncbi:MAG: aminoacyl-tRNA hydrolase [Sphingomonadales bacterium]